MLPDIGRRYALCVGIGQYTALGPAHFKPELKYAASDAKAVADLLQDPQRGAFVVTLLTEPAKTTKQVLDKILNETLNAQNLKPEDMVVIYFACHGMTYGANENFCLLPSDAQLNGDGRPQKLTIIDIHDLAKTLAGANVNNIVFLLDACYSGGAGSVLQHLDLRRDLNPGTNLSIITAAQWDQHAYESSKAQHGIFTDCLLQACKQKPTRDDGWLTIKQIGTFINTNIQSYKTVSKIHPPEISISVSELLVVKNPRYSPQNIEFYERVRTLLVLAQYEPADTALTEENPPGFYIAELKAGFTPHRYGIFPYYNEVEALTNEEVQKISHFLKKLIKQKTLERGMLVTKRKVSSEVKALPFSDMLEIITEESIWKKLIDFKKYLRGLIEMYKAPSSDWSQDDVSLASIYIHLNAERRPHEQETYPIFAPETRSAAESNSTTWQGDLEEEVKRWLVDPNPKKSSLALLGSYGSGKTTFCRHMAATLAQEYLTAHENGDAIHRIPLWIPLLNFAKSYLDLDTLLVAHLKNYCKVDNPSAEALLKMAESGLIFFMFDGFDEMVSRANTSTVQHNISLIRRLTELSHNKVLLTARPEYFMNLNEEQRTLRSFPSLSLQPLNDQQVKRYLQKRVPSIKGLGDAKDWLYYYDKIQTIYGLSNLMQRPVLLEMIVKTLPTLIAKGKAVDLPNLYQGYLEEELERQNTKQRNDLQIGNQQRFVIMKRIALWLYRAGVTELTSDQIREISKGILTSEQKDELDGSLREILACSFLNRIGDTYHFSHLSFLEYLIASCLAQDIVQGRKETFGLKPISPTIQDFLLKFETGVKQRSADGTIRVDTDNKDISFDYKTLEKWFCENSKDQWVSSNAISLLAKLMSHDQFCKIPLVGADLSGTDLRGANLSGIIFSKVVIHEVSEEIISYGGDIGGAIGFLFKAWFPGWIIGTYIGRDVSKAMVETINSTINRANHGGEKSFIKEYLDEVSLIRTNLSGANLSGANLIGANLIGADLTGADLTGADLTGANLIGADLRGADLRGADLTGTDLIGADLIGAEQGKAEPTATDLLAYFYLMLKDFSSVKRVWTRTTLGFAMSLERTDMRSIKGITTEHLQICQQRGAIIDKDATVTDASPQDKSVQ